MQSKAITVFPLASIEQHLTTMCLRKATIFTSES